MKNHIMLVSLKDIPLSQEECEMLNQKRSDSNLINLIHLELNKKHIADDHAKMSVFLICLTSLLLPVNERMSANLKGDSSAGKSNLADSVIMHFPNYIEINRATAPTLEDDIGQYDIVYLKELNQFRESGANKDLIETIKGLTDGGLKTMKKDAQKGFKASKFTQQQQKSVICSTTDFMDDEERATRFIDIPILNNPSTNSMVNNQSLINAGELKKFLVNFDLKDTWIKLMIYNFKAKKVLLPFMKLLINFPLFDNANPRSKRDVKRLLALTKAVALMYQEQRYTIEIEDDQIVLGEPEDFINALLITSGFLNQSYKGYDKRLDEILEKIEELSREPTSVIEEGEDKTIYACPRHILEQELQIAKNTLKSKLKLLRELGLVSCAQYGNIWYYTRCQKGCHSQFIGVKLVDIKERLSKYDVTKIDTFEMPFDTFADIKFKTIKPPRFEKSQLWGKGVKISPEHTQLLLDLEFEEESISLEEIDTPKLTPLKKPNLKELLSFFEANPDNNYDKAEKEFGETQIKKWLNDGTLFEEPAGTLKVLK